MIWDTEKLSKPPKFHLAEDFVADDNIKAIFYEGLPWKGRKTQVFAWYGIPDTVSDEKLPAMVLIHGGGGTAFAEWVRLWTKRGYAVIAMDLCGCVPKGEYGNWNRHDSGGPPGWGGFDQIDWDIEDQWTYHAIADIILAHSLIADFPEIDPERIGMTGISWGGYLNCIASGVDNRFKFGVPVYGCGFLGENSCWLPVFAQMGEEKARKWIDLWDPSRYLLNATMPMLWVTGTNDFAYPMDSLQKSYRATRGHRQLCIKIRMPHGHGGAGENPEEIHVFANSLLKGGEPLAEIIKQELDSNTLWATYNSIVPIVDAELCYTKDTGDWFNRMWYSTPADLNSIDKIVSAKLPPDTTACYLNIIDERNLVSSTEHLDMRI